MTTPTTEIAHSFARDRAPVDDYRHITAWRYRWNCACGRTGPWRASERLAHRDWTLHAQRMTQMNGAAS